MGWRWRLLFAACACCIWPIDRTAHADAADFVTVEVGAGQSLRDVARQHLGDPDLWPAILAINGLNAVTEVGAGMALKLPVTQLARANRAIQAALDGIQAATREGARLFAAEPIAEAILLHDEAVSRRAGADYAAAVELAGRSAERAAEALGACQAQRAMAAEALLSDRQGWVEGQRPEDLVWSDRVRNAVLIEEEKVRTLSRSTAQITFRDDSRLRLNANSHAVIQRMRVDPLSRREEAEVSLIEGDFYALLGGRSERKRFEVQVAEVESDIQSTSFWVSKKADGAKFTNYDDRTLTVSAEGESVTLGRNEGTVVRPGRPPEEKAGLLDGPMLLAPADAGEVATSEVTFRWQPIDQAAGYWLEIARDPDYRQMAFSRWGLMTSDYVTDQLAAGTYYWRIAGLDRFGLPGSRSETWQVRRAHDVTPPFLTIERPAEGVILRDASLRLEGTSEPGARLSLDGRPLAVGADGGFALAYEAAVGINQVTIEATDAAGNVTRRSRSFVVMPDDGAAVTFASTIPRRGPDHFVTATDAITLTGTTTPGARLSIGRDGAPLVTAHADQAGRFTFNLAVAGEDRAFRFTVTAPSGSASEGEFRASVDRVPPAIALDAPPPPVTSAASIVLQGRLDEDASLTLDGAPVTVTDRAFTAVVPLTGEQNRIELAATDPVGNVRLASWEVRLDQTPPALLGHRLSRDAVAGDQAYLLEVEASDPSGMPRAAPFTLLVDGRAEEGLLSLDPASGRYQAKVVLDRPAAGPVRLRDVELEDYAGNRRRYMIE